MTALNHTGKNHPQQECFLCPLDQHSCFQTQLEGRIISAQERLVNGEKVPVIVLDTGTRYAEIELTRYYRTLLRGLFSLGKNLHQLRLRVYHLPTPPVQIEDAHGYPRFLYSTNTYTLAVLEPDTLLNITDLNQAEYCARQYLLQRLIPSTTSPATIRGNLVHHTFKELLKGDALGELKKDHQDTQQEKPLAALHRHFEQELESYSLDLALANVSAEAIRADVMPHLESLATWYENQRATLWDMPTDYIDGHAETGEEHHSENMVRAETFLLAPEIGLRGRLDLLWRQSGRQRLLELKTGGAKGSLPKSEHQWQVRGYHALLTVRRETKMKKALATLLYSGTPGEAQAFGIPFTVRELQRVNETRNILVLSHVTGIPPAPPGPSRCTKCSMLNQCEQVSALLDWRPPETADKNENRTHNQGNHNVNNQETNGRLDQAQGDPCGRPYNTTSSSSADIVGAGLAPALDSPSLAASFPTSDSPVQASTALFARRVLPTPPSAEDREFFAKFYHLLQLEGRASEQQQALLWKTPVTQRIEQGTALGNLQPACEPDLTEKGEWQQVFRCQNTSELREGDEVLLSDGDPVTGEVVTGTIVGISAEEVRVWSPELIAHPSLLDRYDTNIVHVRTQQNLLRWLQANAHIRALVAGKLHPRFKHSDVLQRNDFNEEQNLAVARALQMEDYLLVQGPPGTGKTSVIAEIVKQLCRQGQRVMLAAFTNQAVDNMLRRLDREGFHEYVRLGHERSVHTDVQERLLKELIGEETGRSAREILQQIPVVASTTATWSSEKYSPSILEGDAGSSLLQFDVAIIDEAGQLTIPAILGALRFARRFILVGDEKQLPPLVLSKEAAEQGLSTSLFSFLKQLDAVYLQEHPEEISACISLREQYRMNKWISHFASKVFYNDLLRPHISVANRLLDMSKTGQSPLAQEALAITQAIHPGSPLVFLDTKGEEEYTRAKASDAEARAVRTLVQGLLQRNTAEADIGIIAPYRAQVATLRRHLLSDDSTTGWKGLSFDTPMSIDTVDRFQGGERQVIIISFATIQTPVEGSPLRDFLTDAHRLNVALTRAQRKLILVGHLSALEPLPYFQRLINYCRGLGTLLTYEAPLLFNQMVEFRGSGGEQGVAGTF